MSKEEAIKLIMSDGLYSKEVMDALQEPCEDSNANQHNSNALKDVGQHTNALKGDLISRQAVIDLISKFILEIHTEGGRDLNAHTNDVLRQILRNVGSDRVLPPVNPQEPKTGHCKDCKYFEYDSVAKVDGIPLIVAHEICSRWGDGCKTSEDGYCFLFEPQESDNCDQFRQGLDKNLDKR